MKIEDNFLDQEKFDELQAFIVSDSLAWNYANIPLLFGEDPWENPTKKDKSEFQFTHMFYQNDVPRSVNFESLTPILDIIQPISLWRIKANLLTRTSEIVKHGFHIDIDGISEEKLKSWSTSIFYMNTNNGYTEFEDGTQVESVANRMVTSPSNLRHRGTSCTDEKIRVVINFNYFK